MVSVLNLRLKRLQIKPLRKHRMDLQKTIATALVGTLAIAATVACGDDGRSREIVYVSENRMHLLKTDGETAKIVNEDVINPQWSPNQRRIAYLTGVTDGTGTLKTWDRANEERSRVPGAPDSVSTFFWSPDSQMIAYQALSKDGANSEVFVYHFEEEKTTLLVTEPAGNVELGNWSGDNAWVVMRIKLGESEGIYMRSVQGVNEVQLTDYPDYRPRFSSDGRRVAFVRTHDDGSTDIYTLVVDDDGPSSASQLTDEDGEETDFEWAPNGRNIIYISDRSGNPDIYAVDTEKKSTRRMTENRSPDLDPRWSRNGSQILFRSEIDGKNHIFTMDFNSGDQVRILEEDTDIVEATW